MPVGMYLEDEAQLLGCRDGLSAPTVWISLRIFLTDIWMLMLLGLITEGYKINTINLSKKFTQGLC